MALQRNFRPVGQTFKYAWLHRFLSNQACPANLPLKPLFVPWTSYLGRSNLTSTFSKATFHHLAEHTLNSNAAYCMNIANWMTTTVNNPNSYAKKVNYAGILWPIENILQEMKTNRNDRIFSKSPDYKKLDGLDIKEIYYTDSRWPKDMLKGTKSVKKVSLKGPKRAEKR